MFKTIASLFSVFLLLALVSGPDPAFAQSEFIVWNVGQGQWTTEVSKTHCTHYDMGGEFDVSRDVLKLCQNKSNRIHLSHWDWDHISFVIAFSLRASSACLIQLPEGSHNRRKEKMLRRLPRCSDRPNIDYNTIYSGTGEKRSNDASSVVVSKNFGILIPGDATASTEKKWARHLSPKIQGLILGHHGSRTSTSELLLKRLPRLQWAVASARLRRYGHPHIQVVDHLRERKIPLLKTEDWGSLHFLGE